MTKISAGRARSRRTKLRGVLRWSLYAALLLFLYVGECNPLIRGWCPLIIIPLATSVAMFEGDLAAGIFGACCGLMLDMANRLSVLGFSALWLLAACPFISLLSRFWIKVNFLSHLIINAAVAIVMGAMDMLFLHWVWEGPQSVISFGRVIVPAYGGAILFSIPVYFLVSLISKKLRPAEERRPEAVPQSAEDYIEDEKN